jgi:hypothetical protein
VIAINGDTIVATDVDWGVKRDEELIDFGGDLLGAALDVSLYGGKIVQRKAYITAWEVSEKQPVDVPGDDQIGEVPGD